ncbi:ALBINO3-like protein 2, chloroplastic [Dioscorea cayenensis subsp. rotundata]|uniref:ALBINO3-like protein 2, chloroplastic n=1 Tax=Dioscorea cayennensis subsp. rotundata TaxID=55577 RepID=A0AB40AJV7_DIOCR|nr:ALBINO3-like protein 2, chloroplastic [Dioscorea cayenensis subsp. rotundata]
MGTAVNLLRRRVPPAISGSLFPHTPFRNLKPITSPNPFSSSPPFCATISFRSFSWYSWTAGPKADDKDSSPESDGSGEGLIHVGDPGAGLALLGSELDGAVLSEAAVSDASWYQYPVHGVVSLLEGFHDFSGLPWWVVIPTSTLALRATLFPVLLLQLKKVGEIARLYPKLPPPLPPPLSGRSYREQFLLFQKKKRELGCPSYLWSFAPFFIQFPCFLLWMASIRTMCLDHHPGFESGGILWFQDLTCYPHGVFGPIFPILIAGLHYTNVQVSFQTFKVEKLQGVLGLLARYYKLYLDVLAIPLVFIGYCVPQGSLVYWVTNSSLTLFQQLCLRSPYVRKKLGLHDEKALLHKSPTESIGEENKGPLELQISAESLSAEKLLDFALEELAKGHQDSALPLLRIATEKNPELPRAHVALGQILCSKGLFAEASESFQQAIPKIGQEDVGLLSLAYFGAGVSQIWQGNKSEGIEHLKRIAELTEPENPMEKACYYRGLVMLGSTLFQQGEKIEAAKYLRRAAAYDPAVFAYVKECEEIGEDQKKQSADSN